MLARLRREFIAITMLLVGLVLIGVLGMTLLTNTMTLRSVTSRILSRALEGDITSAQIGDTTGEQSAEIMLAVVVDVHADGTRTVIGDSPLEISPGRLDDVIDEVMHSVVDEGDSEAYPISWRRASMPWGVRIALVDTYSRDAALRYQAVNGTVIFFVSMGALFAVSYVLSGWALRPVERAWAQQHRFVSDASHELKTPLTVILANMQILQRDEGLDKESKRWVESTIDEAAHMRELVDELLTLARADERTAMGGKGSAETPTIDVSNVVEGCCLEFDPVAYERGCLLEPSVEPGVTARIDASDYRRVVRVLLDNATKYARSGTSVRVTLGRDGRRSRLVVNNSGEVIDPNDLEHLFDRFFRTDRARERREEGGFGLGLSIAHSIVTSAGGTIDAVSNESEGTSVVVTL